MRLRSTHRARRRQWRSLALGAVLPALLVANVTHAASLSGRFAASWGDPPPWTAEPAAIEHTITDAEGGVHVVHVPESVLERVGGLLAVDGRSVIATLDAGARAGDGPPRVAALAVAEKDSAVRASISGTSAWITLPCRFADKASEQRDRNYFEQMYGNTPGRLDHFWREVSFGAVSIDGQAIDWVQLPYPQAHYASTPGSGSSADKTALFTDCVAAAEDQVDFGNSGNPYDGINMMFNDTLDCCAWGGNRYTTLDGVSKSWRVTWNPPWAFTNETVIAHEMGHGFGLPHSNNSDGDSSPYDNPWDVMSDAWSNATSDATYGTLGKHVNAYHKDLLGWFPAQRRVHFDEDGIFATTLDDLAMSGAHDPQLAVVDIDGTRFYTVEARDFTSYDAALPGNAIIIHEVDPGRSEPAWVVDGDQPPATQSGTEGVMWRVGERFVDPEASIAIEVTSKTVDGFLVTISRGASMLLLDGFEAGNASAWSTRVP